jgi:DNA repair protein RadA/Sms
MPKLKTVFVCSECGHQAPKWEGRCPACEAWNSYVEEADRPRRGANAAPLDAERAVLLEEVRTERLPRLRSGIGELDRVLGGGVVPGSLVLVSGDPGIGKSTLLLQLCAAIGSGASVLYASGEESLHQVKLRAERLGLGDARLHAVSTGSLPDVLAELERLSPTVAVVDSVQTISDPDLGSAAGSVAQVREVAGRLAAGAKRRGTAVFLVGHVNKEGAIAGPRVLEHLVDTVLYLEGEPQGQVRLLRSQKNRFGSTDEIGIFEMSESGLREAVDPSRAFFDEGSLRAAGASVFPAVEGTRPLMVEIQSLVCPTAFGLPRRTATGIELNRVHMLLAVLEKRAGCPLGGQDVYVNVVGGVRLEEPAADLALALSIVSNLRDQPLPRGLVVVGEVGLAGEIREARALERRLAEAARLGFERALVAPRGAAALSGAGPIRVEPVSDIRAAIEACFK